MNSTILAKRKQNKAAGKDTFSDVSFLLPGRKETGMNKWILPEIRAAPMECSPEIHNAVGSAKTEFWKGEGAGDGS